MHRLLFNTSNAEDVSSVFSLPTETSDIISFRFIRISRYNMNTYPMRISTLESGLAWLHSVTEIARELITVCMCEQNFYPVLVFVPARELSSVNKVFVENLFNACQIRSATSRRQYFFARDVFLIVRLINKIELILLLNHRGALFIN